MRLDLSPEEAAEVYGLLEGALRDLSHEIAATDNARFRGQLVQRRQLLADVAERLGIVMAGTVRPAQEVERELSHPGG